MSDMKQISIGEICVFCKFDGALCPPEGCPFKKFPGAPAVECPEIRWDYNESKEAWAAHIGSVCIGNARERERGGISLYRAFKPDGGSMGHVDNIDMAKMEVEKYGREFWAKIHGGKA